MINIGERIKEIRQKRGMTQTELGNKIGVKKVTINKYEQNRTKHLGIDVIEKIAIALKISPANLLKYGYTRFDLNDPTLTISIGGHKLTDNQVDQIKKTALQCIDKKMQIDLNKSEYEFLFNGKKISNSDWKAICNLLKK